MCSIYLLHTRLVISIGLGFSSVFCVVIPKSAYGNEDIAQNIDTNRVYTVFSSFVIPEEMQLYDYTLEYEHKNVLDSFPFPELCICKNKEVLVEINLIGYDDMVWFFGDRPEDRLLSGCAIARGTDINDGCTQILESGVSAIVKKYRTKNNDYCARYKISAGKNDLGVKCITFAYEVDDLETANKLEVIINTINVYPVRDILLPCYNYCRGVYYYNEIVWSDFEANWHVDHNVVLAAGLIVKAQLVKREDEAGGNGDVYNSNYKAYDIRVMETMKDLNVDKPDCVYIDEKTKPPDEAILLLCPLGGEFDYIMNNRWDAIDAIILKSSTDIEIAIRESVIQEYASIEKAEGMKDKDFFNSYDVVTLGEEFCKEKRDIIDVIVDDLLTTDNIVESIRKIIICGPSVSAELYLHLADERELPSCNIILPLDGMSTKYFRYKGVPGESEDDMKTRKATVAMVLAKLLDIIAGTSYTGNNESDITNITKEQMDNVRYAWKSRIGMRGSRN